MRGSGKHNVWNMSGLPHLGLEHCKEALKALDWYNGVEPQVSIWYFNKWQVPKEASREEFLDSSNAQ